MHGMIMNNKQNSIYVHGRTGGGLYSQFFDFNELIASTSEGIRYSNVTSGNYLGCFGTVSCAFVQTMK